jgi:hypothetical protein
MSMGYGGDEVNDMITMGDNRDNKVKTKDDEEQFVIMIHINKKNWGAMDGQ